MDLNEPHHEKTNILVSDLSDTSQAEQLQKMARGRLEISDPESRGIVLSV